MTDNEFLDLAAKAIGAELHFATGPGLKPEPWIRDKGHDRYWNPLTDDGDAFRLAITLRLRIDASFRPSPNDANGVGVWTPNDREFYPPFWQTGARDPLAAARSAIVRAAAELGKMVK